MEIKIVIPSHKRWDRVATTKAVSNAIICVEESQAELYEKNNPGIEIVTHPDSIIGLARKRDWIIKHFGNVFMLDDDISVMKRVYVEPGEEIYVKPDIAFDLIQQAGLACHAAGFHLFGFSHAPAPLHYKSLNPIQIGGYFTGCAHGVLAGSKLWYNQDIICNEDYWISALNAYHHRGGWKDTRFSNNEAEEADFKLLQRVFGSEVINFRTNKKSLKHEFQKTLKLPFL